MTGIGNDFQVASLSNCFVIGIDGAADSYGGIIRIDEEQVQLMKRRGGVGHDLSHIRPKGSPVKNSALTSTGLLLYARTKEPVVPDDSCEIDGTLIAAKTLDLSLPFPEIAGQLDRIAQPLLDKPAHPWNTAI